MLKMDTEVPERKGLSQVTRLPEALLGVPLYWLQSPNFHGRPPCSFLSPPQDVIQVSKKFLPSMAVGYSSSKLTLHVGDGFEFMKQNQDAFDVIITDSSDPMGEQGLGPAHPLAAAALKPAPRVEDRRVPETPTVLFPHQLPPSSNRTQDRRRETRPLPQVHKSGTSLGT